MKPGYGYYILMFFTEPQDIGGQMLPMDLYYLNTNVESVVTEYAESLKEKPFIKSVTVAKVKYELN